MKKKIIKNNKGQTMVEGVLLLVVFIAITFTVSKQFKDNKLIAKLVSGPWDRLDGMIQNGVWEEANAGRAKHPNHLDRHVSTKE